MLCCCNVPADAALLQVVAERRLLRELLGTGTGGGNTGGGGVDGSGSGGLDGGGGGGVVVGGGRAPAVA